MSQCKQRREVPCGKILCVFLGGATPHRFALSEKGSRGAASSTDKARRLVVFSPPRLLGGGVMSWVSATPGPESLLCSPVE